jgi:hypothetical protein
MNRANLIPDTAEVELVCLRQRLARSKSNYVPSRRFLCARVVLAARPGCTVDTDAGSQTFPGEGVPVEILLQARKFFCDQQRCSRRIFTEKLPGTVERYSRRSRRSSEALSAITMSLGGRAGARLARKLGLLASGPTLLRVLRMQSRPSRSSAPWVRRCRMACLARRCREITLCTFCSAPS